MPTSQYVGWGVLAPQYPSGGDPWYTFGACDEGFSYRVAGFSPADCHATFTTDLSNSCVAQVRQFAWQGTPEECTAAWRDQWVRVRVRLVPKAAAHAYTMSVETDVSGKKTEQIEGLDAVSQTWRLAIGSTQVNAQAGRVLIRNVKLVGPCAAGAAPDGEDCVRANYPTVSSASGAAVPAGEQPPAGALPCPLARNYPPGSLGA